MLNDEQKSAGEAFLTLEYVYFKQRQQQDECHSDWLEFKQRKGTT